MKRKLAPISNPLTIGQIAKQARVAVDTVRFYERKGIILEPPRLQSGYRQYDHSVVHQIQFIKRAQDLGFTLREVRELLALRAERKASCGAVKDRSENKIAEIDGKILDLKRMKRALLKISDACSKKCTTEDCPIVDCFGTSGCCT